MLTIEIEGFGVKVEDGAAKGAWKWMTNGGSDGSEVRRKYFTPWGPPPNSVIDAQQSLRSVPDNSTKVLHHNTDPNCIKAAKCSGYSASCHWPISGLALPPRSRRSLRSTST